MKIDKATYPGIWMAITHVMYDNGIINRNNPEPASLEMPFTEEQCEKANAALEALDDERLETFAIGEETDHQHIKAENPDLIIAGDILNYYFEHLT